MSTATAGGLRPAAAVRWTGLRLAQVAGLAALSASVAASFLLAAAAAERPSVLSPPSRVAFPGWMAGPLHGLLPQLTADPVQLHVLFTAGLAVLGVAWLGAWASARRLPAVCTIAAVAAAQLAFVLGPPQALTDIFNYVQYGRMAARGIDPYAVIPLVNHADPVFKWTNWSHLPSPYGPLFTALAAALAPLAIAGAYWALKLLLLAASLGICALVWTGVRRAGRDPRPALALVGLNPLVLAFGLGGLHNDPLVVLAGVAAVVLGVGPGRIPAPAPRAVAAGLSAAAAVALKPSAAVFAPLVWLGARGRRSWALLGLAAGGLAVVLLTDLAFGGHLPAVGLQSRLVSPVSVPNVTGALLGLGGATAAVRTGADLVLVAAVVLACLALLRGASLAAATGWVAVAVVLTLSWTMPWYVLWVLPFAALTRSKGLRIACVVLTVWLGLSWIPQMPALLHDLGWHPTASPVGHAAHAYIERLLH